MKPNELVIGNLFITKHGAVWLYLGKSLNADYTFYEMAQLVGNFDVDVCQIYFEELQLSNITSMIKAELQIQLDKRCVKRTKYISNLIKTYKGLSFTQEEVKLWLQKNELLGMTLLSDLADLQGKKAKDLYVKAKDLIPGHVYYTGKGYDKYVYLGRNEKGYFMWWFVGNMQLLRRISYLEMVQDKYLFTITQTNKKVKDVWNYKEDGESYLCNEVVELGKEKFAKSV